jgi:hypothetical protein
MVKGGQFCTHLCGQFADTFSPLPLKFSTPASQSDRGLFTATACQEPLKRHVKYFDYLAGIVNFDVQQGRSVKLICPMVLILPAP